MVRWEGSAKTLNHRIPESPFGIWLLFWSLLSIGKDLVDGRPGSRGLGHRSNACH